MNSTPVNKPILWQPSASLDSLKQRAMLYREIRQFFHQRDVLEVDVPILSSAATVDPFIDSLTTCVMSSTRYLQTSPEFFLKRLLSVFPCDVYSLAKAFRQDEQGARHNPEFTMLEWYRVGWNEQQLIDEVKQLIMTFLPGIAYQSLSYDALFIRYLSIKPHTATLNELRAYVAQHIELSFEPTDSSTCLDLLFTHCIEPMLPTGLLSIYDYPASQSALARVEQDAQGQQVAKRFEVYLNGMELANGYWELKDAKEQERRFQADQAYRQANGLADVPYDQALVDALYDGDFPDCAGVALGVDRLLMCCLGEKDIQQVLSFTERL